MNKLTHEFFLQPTVTVAQSLIGQGFYFFGKTGIITETEAYVGEDDPACHAACGKTARNAVMYGTAGKLYIYFIYGMYHCLNIVTEAENFPAAVLLRGLFIPETQQHLNGPGKLCKAFGIDRSYNAVDICHSDDIFFFNTSHKLLYLTTPRIGISKAKEKLWRFYTTEKISLPD